MADATEAFLRWISDSGSNDLQTRRNVSQAFIFALRHCCSVFLIRFDRYDGVARGEAIATAFALDKPTSYELSAKFSRRAVDYRVRPGDRRTMFA